MRYFKKVKKKEAISKLFFQKLMDISNLLKQNDTIIRSFHPSKSGHFTM